MAGSPVIESEHLLLGILRERPDLFGKLTEVPAMVLRKKIERTFVTREKISTSVELPLSMATKRVLARAHEESDVLGHRHIGPEHLLLGLMGEQGSLAAEALHAVGITRAGICNLTSEEISPEPQPTLTPPTLQQQLTRSLFSLLRETFEEVQGLYLDKGTSLFETLAGVSAEEASRPIADNCATIAAQVEHLRFYLEVVCDVIVTRKIEEVDWKEIWQTVRQVTPEEWEVQKGLLRETYDRTMTTLNNINRWNGKYEIGCALSILSHTSYHLGGIRQALGAIRSGRKNAE